MDMKKKEIAAKQGTLFTIISIRIPILKKTENLDTNDSKRGFKSCRYEEIDKAVLE